MTKPVRSWTRRGLVALAALLLAGCTDDPSGARPVARLEVFAAPAPNAPQGTTLADSVAVRVLDAGAAPIAGVQVQWAVTAGGGTVSPAQGTTNADGVARAAWTLGPAGPQRITASAGDHQVELTTQSLPDTTFFLDADSVQVALGGRVRVVARQNDPFGNEQGIHVTWTSLEPRIAHPVPVFGADTRANDIVGMQVGTTRVVAASGARTDTVVVRVVAPAGAVSWTRERGEAALRRLTGVWGSSAGDVYVSADSGSVYRWDGQRWRRAPRITTQPLSDVWGASSTDVFVVGAGGTVLRGSGDSWTGMSTPVDAALNDVWGTSASDVWAVGGAGTILHYDGAAWTATPSGATQPLYAVWGSGFTVFAVGDSGTIVRRTGGGAWETMASGTTQHLRGVWGTGPQQVYALTGSGGLLRWDGVTWTRVLASGPQDSFFNALGGVSPTQVFLGGGRGSTSSFFGHVWRWNGTDLSQELSVPLSSIRDVWGVNAGTAFAVSGEDVWRWNGGGWTRMSSIAGTLRDVWALDAENAFAIGDDGAQTVVLRRTAGGWQPMPRPSPAGALFAVTALSPTQVWVGASDGVYRWDGAAWYRVYISSQRITDVYAVAADQVYAVGDGLVLRASATTWTSIGPTFPVDFYHTPWEGVWASGANDVWVVGREVAAHYDGTSWTGTRLQGFRPGVGMTNAFLFGVSGTASNNVYAAGSHVFRWNGTEWTDIGREDAVFGEDVWASPGGAYVAGRVLRRFDGTRWTTEGVDAAEGAYLYGVHGAGGHVYAVGEEQTVLHGTP